MKEMKVKKGYHCAWDTHYHMVCPVKYRKALLDQEVVDIIITTTKGIQERYAIEFEAIGADENHIHIITSAHPKLGPGRIIQIFKSITAREIFKQKPAVKKELWGGEFWSDGYYVQTVGAKNNWATVEKYVREQGKDPKKDLRQLSLF